MPSHPDPTQPPPRPRLRRSVRAAAAGAAAIVVVAIVAARQAPGWYATRVAGVPATAERDARRLVTEVAGLRAAATRPGAWGAAVREEEINAWLATDLPRNHVAALPAGLSEPRVRLEPGRIRVAARTAVGPLAGVASIAVEVRLRPAGRLECAVVEARIGAIPVPAGPVVHRLAALLDRLGFATETRRLDGRSVIVVSLGGRGAVLRGLTVDAGELVVAGTTEEVR
ncbi:MAG: hypothetical protein ACKOSQ_08085 [Planctomycetaceae bacterium]